MLFNHLTSRFRQGFLSVFYFFVRIPRNQTNGTAGENYAMNPINNASAHNSQMGGNSLHPGQHILGSNGSRRPSGSNSLLAPNKKINDTTVRLNGSAVSTTLASPKSVKNTINVKIEQPSANSKGPSEADL